jgi:hypothetical protein
MECGDFLGTTSPEPDHNVLRAWVLKIFCDQLDTRRFYYILLKLASHSDRRIRFRFSNDLATLALKGNGGCPRVHRSVILLHLSS